MVAFFNFFVKCSQNATVVDVAGKYNHQTCTKPLKMFPLSCLSPFIKDFYTFLSDHINYIRGRIGIDTIGIGSGYDGINFVSVCVFKCSRIK